MKSLHLMIASVVLAGGALQASEILTNPGFESGALSPWANSQDFGSTSPWAITGSNCHSGSFCATSTGNIELQQNFAGVATTSITDVSFWALHPDDTVTATAVDFFYQGGGSDEFIVNTAGTGWNFFDVFANLRASDTLVGIGVFGNSGGVTMVDDFSISSNAAGAVPEPATIGMLGIGIAGLIAARRKMVR